MKENKPLVAISVDLDNLWSYMKIHGDNGWDQYPSYLNIFIPVILDLLDELNLKITFFIVGRDTEPEENRKYLRMITERGHEVGNHSYNHESWLQSYSYEEIEEEITRAEAAIENVTGLKPRGFRGPGFSWSPDLLKVLEKRGYLYDTTTLPTWIGSLARLYYFSKSSLGKAEKNSRKELFGKFSEGFRKLRPYYFDLGEGKKIMEIPVTTMPLFRVPFHLSYLIYLAGFSPHLMRFYLNIALFLCRITWTPVCFLVHPLDVMGYDKVRELDFFPGMNQETERKTALFKEVLTKLTKNFKCVPLSEFHGKTGSFCLPLQPVN